MAPIDVRKAAWAELAKHLDMTKLAAMEREVAFDEVIGVAPQFLEGKIRGRIVVPVAPDLS